MGGIYLQVVVSVVLPVMDFVKAGRLLEAMCVSCLADTGLRKIIYAIASINSRVPLSPL